MPYRGDNMINKFAFAFLLAFAASTSVNADDSKDSSPIPAPLPVPKNLTKKETQSCEAVLCLAGGGSLSECANPLKVYYDIKKKKRADFLKICPKD